MISIKTVLCILVVTISCSISYAFVINSEFVDPSVPADSVYHKWVSAGSNAVIDSVFTINVRAIPDSVTYHSINDSTYNHIPPAVPDDDTDDSFTFSKLIIWMRDNITSHGIHAQIYIPPGTYNFSDQIIMSSNISLKGAGSHQTELRFLIRADSTSTTMSTLDCRKDAILVSGSDDNIKYNIGIEDLKIVRIREGLSEREVKEKVGDHSCFDNTGGYPGYWGNSIAIRRATDCWVKGVESENTFRNHITLEYANNNTISGVYFHDANDYGDGGYGYGVGLWNSCNNKVENSIFRHVRHAVTIVDKSWFNVIAYNYVREQHSTILVPYIGEISTHWSDITIHGESYNTWQSEEDPTVPIDSLKTPYYNLIEGNNLEYLCVDATHQHNGSHNTFLRNRVIEQIHVQGYDGFPDALTTTIVGSLVLHPLAALYLTVDYYIDGSVGDMYGWIGLMGLVDYLVTSYVSLQFCCSDCAIMRIADQLTYLMPGSENDTHRFKNQPRQLFVNNYAREYNWWKCQILDYPIRMHSEIDQYQANTYKRYVNFWGRKKGKNCHGNDTAYSDTSYYQLNQSEKPAFWPIIQAWPYMNNDSNNPANERYHAGGKLTVGEEETGYSTIIPITESETRNDDLVVNVGTLLRVSPGITVKFAPGKGIISKGFVRIGEESGTPVVFTCLDTTQTWAGIRVFKESNATSLPFIEMYNCDVMLAGSRALYLRDYSNATLTGCRIVNNTGDGGIYSEKGNMHIEDCFIGINTLGTTSNQFGAGLYLKSTDAEIVNTYFVDNSTQRSGTGALHIAADTDTTRVLNLYNCYFSGNTGSDQTNQGWGVHVDDFLGTVSLYNCSFIEQDKPIQSNLAEDVLLTNCLFWNPNPGEHTLASNNYNSPNKFLISRSYISHVDSYTINGLATILDTLYTGTVWLCHENEDLQVFPYQLSQLVNAGNPDIYSSSNIRNYLDLLGNPRVSGRAIDVGAIEVMKPELVISDTSIDFGMVDVFCVADSTIRIENIGTEDLELYSISLPTGYTVDQTFPLTVPTGYTSTSADSLDSFIDLRVSFSPIYHQIDYLDKLITIATNDSLYQSVVINVSGIGRAAELSISDSTLVLADFPANNTPSFGREFVIFKNTGNAELVIDSLQVSADFQYAISDSIEQERKSTVVVSLERNSGSDKSRGTLTRPSLSSLSLASATTGLYQRLDSNPRSLDYVKNLTWHGFGQMQQLSIPPGDSVFINARYIPYQITVYHGSISLSSNDSYDPDRTIELSGQGIPLVVTDNPTETQVYNVITADTLWTCPQIEVKSNVEIMAQSRLTIRPYKAEIAVKADSTSMIHVYGELHARRSLNQQFSVTFAGVDSLSGWKGIAFLNNAAGTSRMDSVFVFNANDYNRTEEGGGAIHTHGYHSLLLNGSVFQGNSSDYDGGSIYLSNGSLCIDNSVFDNNAAVRGGSIAVEGLGSELSITSSGFNHNHTSQSGGAISVSDALVSLIESTLSDNMAVYGGALSVSGDQSSVTVSSSVFEQNGDLNSTGGAVYHAGGQLTIDGGTDYSQNTANIGGAIAVVGSTASVSVVNTAFNQNIALLNGGAITSLDGNVVLENSSFSNCSSQDSGGALALFDSNYAITRNTFTNCLAASANGKGGSIYVKNPASKTDKGSTKLLTEQRILRSNEIRQSSANAGGAIYQDGSGSIVSNAITQNHASIGAGLYLKNSVGLFENNTIADNIASGIGGAIVCDSLGILIKNSIIWVNSQTSGNPIHCLNGQIIDLVNCAIEDTLQITSGSLLGSSTQNCQTDDPAFDSASPTPYQLSNTSLCVNGGTRDSNLDGVDALGNPRINVSNGTPIIDIGAYEFMGPYWVCTRDTIPDYVEITYSPTYFVNDLNVTNTGTLHLDPGVSFLAQNNSMIKVKGSVDAPGTENAGISFSTALENPSWYGFSFEGGISAGSSTFQHCSFSNGKAYSGTIHTGHDASNGGVMYINGYPAIQIDNCSFSSNQASDSGGAIYVTNIALQDSILITNSHFTSNKVKEGSGGAVCSNNSRLHLQNNLFSLNTAGYPLDQSFTPDANGTCGGAISLVNSQTSSIDHAILDNQFHANSAAGSGGGIYAIAGLQRIIGNQFYDSIALGADKSGSCSVAFGGGAIGVVGRANSVINLNTFESNYAYAGGAILNNDSVSNVADNSFNGNKAQYGGAIQLINIDTPNSLTSNLFTANGTSDSTICVIGGAIRMLNCHHSIDISLSKFTGNSSSEKGGAIAIQNSNRLIFVNNQISNNIAVNGGGIFIDDSEISFSNNTLAHNVGTTSGGGVFIDGSRMESINNLHWSNSAPIGFEVQLIGGSTMSVYNSFLRQTQNAVKCQTGSMITYTQCIGEEDQPPLLINDSHNYNLKPDSPCVNSGDINVYHTLTDLNLRNRIVGGRIDIGAYEYSGTTIEDSPVDSLTIWDDTCITIVSPIIISDGKKLIIDDNVSVFFEENGSLYVENSTLEARNNVSFVSETHIPGYHIMLKDAAPVSLIGTSALGVKLKTETTFMIVEHSIFNNSFLSHNNQSLVVSNSEFSASNLDAVNTSINIDTLIVSIVGSYFHDKPDSTAIRIYSYPSFMIIENTISNYYSGISLFESGQGKVFSLGGNNIEGNQYGYGIQAYHSNIDMNSSGSVKNNFIGLGGFRNSSLRFAGNREPPYQSFNNNYSDEMAFTHDSFPKDLRHNLIYDSLRPSDILLRCINCDESTQYDISYNYWNLANPLELIVPSKRFLCEPIWNMDASIVPEIAADQDLFELAKYNLRIGHNDLAVIQFKDLIENYPDTEYKEEAAKLLMAASGSSSAAIYDLQHFYATEPNLHNEIGIEKLADYLVNYCNLKLEDYQAVIDWYEDIILNPPSVADSIYAVIDLGYTYLLMNAADDRTQYVGKYTQYIPKSLQTFRQNLDVYINQLLHLTPASSNVPPVPISFVLHQNYPNPFNPTTTIAFEIPEDAPAQLAIYNIRGQLVKEIRYEILPKGYYRLVWDGRDLNNRSVGSGVYFYRMTYKGKAITKKMCIVK